jgi:MFS transporter, ACS family, aldohexuronate transporter
MINNWFPHQQAATGIGVAFVGSPLGGPVSGPIVGLLAAALGWRVSFLLVGALGLIWLAVWLARITEGPAGNRRVSEAERCEIEEDRAPLPNIVANGPENAHGLDWYLRCPVVLATSLAFIGYNYVLYFFLTWFPTYLTMAQHLSNRRMSFVTVLPWMLGFLGLALGGWITDLLLRRTPAGRLSRTVCPDSRSVAPAGSRTRGPTAPALSGLPPPG